MKTNGNDTMYPQQTRSEVMHPENNGYADPIVAPILEGGLTKREYFAGLAMQGLLANPHGAMTAGNVRTVEPYSLCKVALAHADELIEALNRTES